MFHYTNKNILICINNDTLQTKIPHQVNDVVM